MNHDYKRLLNTIRKAKIAVDVEKLDQVTPLRDQGIDSLDLTGILFEIEEEYGIKISEEEVEQVQSIEDILNFIQVKAE